MTHKQGFGKAPKTRRVFHVSPASLPSYAVAKGRPLSSRTAMTGVEWDTADPEAARVSDDVADALLAGGYDDILGLTGRRRP